MEARLQECAVSDENAACADRCFQELQAVVVELGPRWRLEVFGSVASGFRTSASDMDATCVQAPSEDGKEEGPVAQSILQERLSPLLRQHGQFQVIEEIVNAKVPILRLRFENHLDIDLSCQNTAALLNTRLLCAYANLHPRVRDLGIAVKLWAKAARVCGAAQGNLSSYSFTLLVIYFMQVHHEVNLPCLPTLLFEEDAAVAEAEVNRIRSSWSCPHSLADLFFRFIGFYSLFFDWGREVVSARVGKRTYSRDPTFHRLRGRHVPRLHIEDPYALERNLHCVLGEAEEVQLREAFQSAWIAMISGATPVGLCPLGIYRNKIAIQLDNSIVADEDKHEMELATSDGIADVKKANVTESPATFSSSGSTESGDDKCAPRVPSCSSGDSRQSDDDCMTVDKEIAATNPKQWWQNLASADIAEAVSTAVPTTESQHEMERPRIISMEDLESRMAHAEESTAQLPQDGEDETFPEQVEVPWHSATTAHTTHEHLQNLARRIASKVKRDHTPTSDSVPSPSPMKAQTNSISASLAAEGFGSMWWRNLGSANVKQAVEASGQEEGEGGRWSRRKRGLRQQGVTVQDLEGQMIQESPQDVCDPDDTEDLNATILPLFGSFASGASGMIASRVASRCLTQA
jgi:hypothetical protein